VEIPVHSFETIFGLFTKKYVKGVYNVEINPRVKLGVRSGKLAGAKKEEAYISY
jgi:hypothetical protein